jgi:hypothetical protein
VGTGVEGRIILKLTLKKQDVRVWTGLTGGSREHGPSSMKCGEFLEQLSASQFVKNDSAPRSQLNWGLLGIFLILDFSSSSSPPHIS